MAAQVVAKPPAVVNLPVTTTTGLIPATPVEALIPSLEKVRSVPLIVLPPNTAPSVPVIKPITEAGSTTPGIGNIMCSSLSGCNRNGLSTDSANTDHFLLTRSWFAKLIWPTTTSEIKDGVISFQNQKPVAVTAVLYDSVNGQKIEFVIPPSLGSGPVSVASDFFEAPITGTEPFVDFVINNGAATLDARLPTGFDLSKASITYKLGDLRSTIVTCLSISANALGVGSEIIDAISGGEIPTNRFKGVLKDILKNALSDGDLVSEYSAVLLNSGSSAQKAEKILEISNKVLIKEVEKELIKIGLEYYTTGLPERYLKKIENVSAVFKSLKVAASVEKTLDIEAAVNFMRAYPEERMVELDKVSLIKWYFYQFTCQPSYR